MHVDLNALFEPQAFDKMLHSGKLRSAASRAETPIHRVADVHQPKVSVAIRYAFAMGRKALMAGMRAAGDVEGHEFHGNQWTTAYHGTVKGSVDRIVREGIQPESTRKSGGDQLAFATTRFTEAEVYAVMRAREGRTKPVIFELHIPADEVPGGNSGSVLGTEKGFKPEWIKAVHTRTMASTGKVTWTKRELARSKDVTVYAVVMVPLLKALASKDLPSLVSSAVRLALEDVLPATLLKALVAGGEVGVKQLRTAGDVEGHPFHGNQWTSGTFGLPPSKEDPAPGKLYMYHQTNAKNLPGIVEGGLAGKHQGLISLSPHLNSVHEWSGLIGNKDKETVVLRTPRAGLQLRSHDQGDPGDAYNPHDLSAETGTYKAIGPDRLEVYHEGTWKPLKVKALATSLTLKFNATDPRAIKWARDHAGELAKNISAVTEERIKAAIATALEGGTLADAQDEIAAAVGDEERADMIARTESMMAANQGQREAWAQAADEGLLPADAQREWIATSGACPECDDLDGEKVGLDEQYPNDGGDGPPLHPNCRCTEGITGG